MCERTASTGRGANISLLPPAFQLLFGKFYTHFSIKWVFLVALFLFELGSLICGVAPSSTALIVGRAIAGFGSSGIFTGALVTIAHLVPLHKRPTFLGMIGGMYGIASVAGPLVQCSMDLRRIENGILTEPSDGRSFHRSRHLAVVFLYQP